MKLFIDNFAVKILSQRPRLLLFLFLFFFFLLQNLAFAEKTIAITIDDLPFVGEYRNFHLNMIINALKAEQVPATGFVIAKEVRKDNWPILKQFRDAGFGLGNHTFSHANLNKISTRKYMYEIKKADSLLKSILTKPKYFRFPYLAMGNGAKKEQILALLKKNNYQIAPITIDSKDFIFNQCLLSVPEMNRRNYLKQIKAFYLDFIWHQTLMAEKNMKKTSKAQILLIHANLLNAYVLPDIIRLYKEKGYNFVDLEQALVSNPVVKASKTISNIVRIDESIEPFWDWD